MSGPAKPQDLEESGKLVLDNAQRIADELGSRSIGTAHLFLGVVALERPVIRRVFAAQALDLDAIAREVRLELAADNENESGRSSDADAAGALDYAKRRSSAGGRPGIEAPHILMAVLADRDGPVAQRLSEAGADLNKLDKELWAMVRLGRWNEASYRVGET
jgi:ATP-dependent Clp protease ATP-binding subunit ClpA